ncbi:hypothetical protein [Nocardioides acrostichi]|uniref:Uncharacterized protein n=1 Tax=Nocardioides acrostichi TaxID=2784339 RepID=A0A930YD93_9ACTN|nr:hypothetical protein [Nocardioides acrostichi]MBF4162249.1 hypothetical protein [Nocardioides acrostichi]
MARMAGGGYDKHLRGVPLAERRRIGGPAAHRVAPSQSCPARHCWVSDAVDGEGEKRPGLLLEWRRAGSGADVAWQGLVVYAARVRAHEWGLVEEWLPADRLAPA